LDILKRNVFVFILSFFLVVVLLYADEAKAQYRVGYRSVATWKQKENIRLDISVWYPTRRAVSEFRLGEFIVAAAKNAPILKIIDEELAAPFRIERELIRDKAEKAGKSKREINQELSKIELPFRKLPLIVLSHDSGGTRYSNYTVALELASQGFIVAIPMHIGDNAFKMPLLGSGLALTERARQISASLDLLLSHTPVSNYIDESNMTFLGFGSGGTAGLLLTGIDLTVNLWGDYCKEFDSISQIFPHATLSPLGQLSGNFDAQIAFDSNADFNPYCMEPFRTRMNDLVVGLQQYFEYNYMVSLFYENITMARKKVAKKSASLIDKQIKLAKRRNTVLSSHLSSPPFIQPYFPLVKVEQPLRDERFARMIFVSPGYSFLFDREGLLRVDKPILFIGLDKDKVNVPKYQSEVLYEAVGEKQATHEMITGTDIWGLQAPCSETDMLVEICKSVTDEERSDLVNELAEIVLDFVPNFEEN